MTSMRILGWKSEGLRCPDHAINCTKDDGSPHEVTLIQMPNGTGKTTTLELLRAAVSGAAEAESWDGSKIRTFQKKGMNRSHGEFEVRLLLNSSRVTVIMSFDFENGRVAYRTTRGDGQVDGFDPPVEFLRYMNPNFVNFFIFDGELAHNLLDREHVHADAVVENLFQINALRTVASKVGEYWSSRTRNVSATEERGLTRRQNKLRNLEDRLSFLTRERSVLLQEQAEKSAQLAKYQARYENEIKKQKERAQRFDEAKSKADALKGRVREEALEVLDMMRDPHALHPVFAQALYDLKVGLDRVKLPETAAREFFKELAEEEECVCARPIDDDVRAIILERSEQYLGSDDVSLLNAMKVSIGDAVGVSAFQPERVLDGRLRVLEEIVALRRDADNELEELRLEAEMDPQVKQARDEIERLEAMLGKLETALAKFENVDDKLPDDRTFGIAVIEKRISEAETKLAEATQTMELKAKRDILIDIVTRAHARAKDLITTELVNQANSRITDLMPNNRLAIDRIDQCLVLEGQEGGSVGETLSIAYAFLSTLFHRSDQEIPFVVDSPAGPIDLAVRPEIAKLVPKLTGQFIAFTISSERAGFVSPLMLASQSEVQFLTVFRQGDQGLDRVVRTFPGHEETSDGFVVPGDIFFSEFQLETEEAS
ncbi:hypothetical protein GWI34_15410 [Actinomadura sp. DSM 109109]|nr:hypothetical protein [Actinomadura lepetitiana]